MVTGIRFRMCSIFIFLFISSNSFENRSISWQSYYVYYCSMECSKSKRFSRAKFMHASHLIIWYVGYAVLNKILAYSFSGYYFDNFFFMFVAYSPLGRENREIWVETIHECHRDTTTICTSEGKRRLHKFIPIAKIYFLFFWVCRFFWESVNQVNTTFFRHKTIAPHLLQKLSIFSCKITLMDWAWDMCEQFLFQTIVNYLIWCKYFFQCESFPKIGSQMET